MDNLRALAMLLGILFHASLAYAPSMRDVWPTADMVTSTALESFAWGSHLFRMPLFFLISGYFTHMLLRRRGTQGLLRNRYERILLPFLTALPICLLMLAGMIVWAAGSIADPSPTLMRMRQVIREEDLGNIPITTLHLWFLYYLFILVLALLALRRSVIFRRLEEWSRFMHPSIYLAVPLLATPALATRSIPHPPPDGLLPELWALIFHGGYFVMGHLLFQDRSTLRTCGRYWLPLLVLGILLYLWLLPMIHSGTPTSTADPGHVWRVLLSAFAGFFLTMGVLGLGKQVLDLSHPLARYIADSSYWLYLVHIPVLFIIQFLLMDRAWGLWPKFLCSVAGTFMVGMVTYHTLVRHTLIGLMLNGKKPGQRKKPRELASPSIPAQIMERRA